MLPGRTKTSLTRFFPDQGPKRRQGVEVVVTDGSTPYKAAIEQYLPTAQHVLDRFHVIRWFGNSLVQLRRDLQRRPAQDRPPAWERSLYRSRCLLLKRGDRLTETEQEQLQSLFDRYPPLETGWQALQEPPPHLPSDQPGGSPHSPRQVHRPLPNRPNTPKPQNRKNHPPPARPNPQLPHHRTIPPTPK